MFKVNTLFLLVVIRILRLFWFPPLFLWRTAVAFTKQHTRLIHIERKATRPRTQLLGFFFLLQIGGTWMSRWKLGSMVSNWVITPTYPIYK